MSCCTLRLPHPHTNVMLYVTNATSPYQCHVVRYDCHIPIPISCCTLRLPHPHTNVMLYVTTATSPYQCHVVRYDCHTPIPMSYCTLLALFPLTLTRTLSITTSTFFILFTVITICRGPVIFNFPPKGATIYNYNDISQIWTGVVEHACSPRL